MEIKEEPFGLVRNAHTLVLNSGFTSFCFSHSRVPPNCGFTINRIEL